MPVLIIGSEGGQGKRYQAILRNLKEEYVRMDVGVQEITKSQMKRVIDKVIVATPTESHAAVIQWCLDLGIGKDFLVEKPVIKNLAKLKSLLSHFGTSKFRPTLSMVHQYRQLVGKNVKGPSIYNYFRHGNDGLAWDCLQIIALAKGKITLLEDSPVWQCKINGVPLFIQDMDKAYVAEVYEWLLGRGFSDPAKIYNIHKRVSEFEL